MNSAGGWLDDWLPPGSGGDWAEVILGLSLGLAIVVAILSSGCTLALLGDARDACYRVEDAISAYQLRCEVDFHGRLDDCGDIVIGATTSSSAADECEAALRDAPCTLRTLPSECRIEGL